MSALEHDESPELISINTEESTDDDTSPAIESAPSTAEQAHVFAEVDTHPSVISVKPTTEESSTVSEVKSSDSDDSDDSDDASIALEHQPAEVSSGSESESEEDQESKVEAVIQETQIVSEDDDEDETDDDFLQKFDEDLHKQFLTEVHPEAITHNYNEISNLTKIVKNKDNIIIDELHRTTPFLTKYEYTRVLGIRTKQINSGAKSFIDANDIIDGSIIALKELMQRKIPFIIRRPLPTGGSEYWNLKDLEIIHI